MTTKKKIHYYRAASLAATNACGDVLGVWTSRAGQVTCEGCRSVLLEQLPDMRGRREYRIPQDVAQRDAQAAREDVLAAMCREREKIEALCVGLAILAEQRWLAEARLAKLREQIGAS